MCVYQSGVAGVVREAWVRVHHQQRFHNTFVLRGWAAVAFDTELLCADGDVSEGSGEVDSA